MENKAAPSFFKIMFGDFSTATTLRIPPAFVENLHLVFPQEFVLETHDGRWWHVTVIEVGSSLYFEAGWREFVQDKSLEHGDFLLFTYADKLHFNVKVFKRTGCIEGAGGGETDSMGEELDASGPCNDSGEENSESFQDELERPRSNEPELAENFSSNYPFFKVALKRTYVNKKGFLHIPCSFSEQHPNLDLTSRHASLRVSDRTWPVNILLIEGTATLRICGGWRAFVTDNHLRENDVCIFELVEMNDIVLNVSLIRSIQGRK